MEQNSNHLLSNISSRNVQIAHWKRKTVLHSFKGTYFNLHCPKILKHKL